jgi:hypothetical protein
MNKHFFNCLTIIYKRVTESIPHLSIRLTELVYDPRLSEEMVEHLQKINTLEELVQIRIIDDPSHPYYKQTTSLPNYHNITLSPHLPLNPLSLQKN